MKLFHLSDLHIGKIVNGYEMWEDQGYVFSQIIRYVEEEHPDAVILAGDIYDKVVPSAKSVGMFDAFLTELAGETAVCIISGNHDSAERLEFGSNILKKQNVYMKGTYDGEAMHVKLSDAHGRVNIYLMPFIKPYDVVRDETVTYTEAMRRAVRQMNLDPSERNILVAHQNVTYGGANKRSESETVTIGGLDNIESTVFDAFDYVALGHLHSPQQVGRPEVRYSGTPVIYSMSEAGDKKSITVVELKEKGTMQIRTLPLSQLHGWYEFTGTLEQALARESNEDYARIILTDRETVIDAQTRLRTVYHNLMTVEFQTLASETETSERTVESVKNLSPEIAVQDFYYQKTGHEMTDEEKKYIKKLISEYDEARR